jgi:hypothetical protein
MNEKCMRGILEGMQADVAGIEEDTREQVEALMEQYEKDKERRMKVGNEALRSAVTNDLVPRHEQFEFAVKKIDTYIGELLGQLVALEHNRIKTPEEKEKKKDPLCADLSFLRFALGVAESVRDKLEELIKGLSQGIGEDDLAWYNDPNNSRSKYYSVPTIDERLREEEEGDFPDRYGYSTTVPILYLGKEFEELNFERPGEWNEDEDRSKAEERIACKLAKFTKQGLIPPVSIRLYPDSPYGFDFPRYFERPFDKLRSDRCFVVVAETECF